MKVDDFIKKHKINKLYSYHEERVGDTVSFGWVSSKALSPDDSVVVSSVSKSKKVLDTDKEWSEKEGNSAATLSDYDKYFQSLTGESPVAFLKAWKAKAGELESVRRISSQKYKEEEGAFLLNLAELISKGKKFSKFGRVYKIVNIDT
jgi:hypothetical protein